MGRLQRKKIPVKKKKKTDGDSAVADAGKKPLLSLTEERGFSQVPKKSVIAGATPEPVKKIFYKILQFLREVKAELRKVTWPSRKQAMGSTAVMIILVMIISFFLGTVDAGLSTLIRVVLQ